MLSEKIRDLRKKAGLSQEELAEKLDVSRQAVSKWELGAAVPTADKLLEISDLFGVSLDHLMRGELRDHDKLDDPDNSGDRASDASVREKTPAKASAVFKKGAAIFLFAVAGLAVLLLVLLCSLLGGDDVKNSLVITLNGVGILAGAAVLCALLGIVLLISLKK